jgi:hypothetical protein
VKPLLGDESGRLARPAANGKRPLASGFFFSFGHSTVIVAVGAGITIAARAVFGAMVNPSSAYETAGGTIGTLLSASFLYLIALLNLIVLAGIVRPVRPGLGGGADLLVVRQRGRPVVVRGGGRPATGARDHA